MKKLVTTIALTLALAANSLAQMSCCAKPSSTNTFAMLSHDKKFVASHLEPTPFVLANPIGKEITYKTPDGKEGYGYEIKATKPTNNYVFVIHEWWGLNDYIKQEAEKIYSTLGNVNVIAIDMYDKKIATTRDSAGKYMNSLKPERGEAIIKGVLNYVGTKANIATIGWCFGGGWSMQASLLAGKQSKACVMYYGMPEDKTEKLKTINAPVLFVWAEKDQWINKEVVTKFEANMKTLNKPLTVKSYDADHAFANPSNPKYSKEFADDAMKNFIEFIKKNLK
ncbi:MAG: dienelactone hydrolase family protein [Bacteroidia bacterium]